jgi:uncharacterized protein (TIGR02452 family)
MLKREEAKLISKEILSIIDKKEYKNIKLKSILEKSKAKLYDDNFEYSKFQNLKEKETKIEIVKGTTIDSSVNFDGCILNFASATNPGGGFFNGSLAQEESLCRASLLYDSISSCENYYSSHKKNEYTDYFYTDKILFSKDVMIFRNSYNKDVDPYYRDFITCAAPMAINLINSDPYTDWDLKLESVINQRIEKILLCILEEGHTKALLGAWGCGAFGNDPYVVAESFSKNLEKYPYFDHVIFSIYEKDYSEFSNFNAFKEVFGI